MSSAVIESVHFVEEIKKQVRCPMSLGQILSLSVTCLGTFALKTPIIQEPRHRFLTSEPVQIQKQKAWLLTKVGMDVA